MEKNDKLVETRRIQKRLVETRGNGENGKFIETREHEKTEKFVGTRENGENGEFAERRENMGGMARL